MDTNHFFTDQMGNRIEIRIPPKRIVSLVPSQTELLADLGLEKEITGITKYCIHPPAWQNSKTLVGGTKNFDLNLIHSLNPDLIIGNKEENYQDGIEQLKSRYPVWMSDISNLDEALSMIESIGQLTDTNEKAKGISASIKESFSQIVKFPEATVIYLIWRKPWMAAGNNTFISSMLDMIGLRNAITTSRYPELSATDIKSISPGYILLSSEPYPFREKHIQELKAMCPRSEILLVDGEMFSWYGSRLLKAPEYFRTLKISRS